jgi:predicted metal-dependent enzyme (double-stranded beta helix superfamily)
MSLTALAPTRPEPLEATLLHEIATGIARARTLWAPAVRHDPSERQPVRLLATERYEVWVIGWAAGQRAELHDHGDAAGALVVVDGTLTERTLGGGPRSTVLPTGTGRDLPVGLVHEIVNDHTGPATSIHVYSPPLTTMTRYDDALRPTVTEVLPFEEPAFGDSADSVLAHPSLRG